MFAALAKIFCSCTSVTRFLCEKDRLLPLAVREYLLDEVSQNIKQLLDEVFVISRIIKVEVGFISRNRRLRLP